MEKTQAKQILTQLKKQVRQREVYEAIDIALESLTWSIVDEKTNPLKEETQCETKTN